MNARDRLAVLAIGLGTAVVPLDSAVNIAFPDITRSFAIEMAEIQWVVISYVLTHTSLMLFCGRLGDRFGRRLIFGMGVAWSIFAFVALTFAPTFQLLLLARVAQGIGAAFIMSCGPALITSLAGEERRARMLGLYMLMFGVGMACGPLVGGWIVSIFGWPGVYGMRVPLCLAALALIWTLPDASRQAAWASGASMNARGAILLAGAVAAVLLTINRLQVAADHLLVPMSAGIGAAVFIRLFIVNERRSNAPILPLHLFRRMDFSGLNLSNALVAGAGFSIMLIVPYFLARLTALDIATAGLVLACGPAGTMVMSLGAGRLIEAIGARAAAAIAAGLTAVGLVGVGLWPAYPGIGVMAATLFVNGMGLGLFQVAVLDVITGTMSARERGVAGSLAQVTRTVGVITAASLLSLAFATLSGGSNADDAAFHAAFGTLFLAVAVPPALVAIWLILGRRREES
jgi:MFS family permease